MAEQVEAPAAALAAAFNRGGEAAAGETLLLLSDLAEPQPGAWAALQAAHAHARVHAHMLMHMHVRAHHPPARAAGRAGAA